LPYFPYVAPPQNPRDHQHHDVQNGPTRAEAAAPTRASLTATAPGADALRILSGVAGSRATLQYSIPRAARVSLHVYDLQGRMVRTLVDQDAAAGTFRASWDGTTDAGTSAAKGIFFARLAVDGRTLDTKKVLIQ